MDAITWLVGGATLAMVAGYEGWLALTQRRTPRTRARSAHASLREDWLSALSEQKGSEILAVQTLRNSMMSATMIASTAVLGLMGTLTLTASSLRLSFGEAGTSWPLLTPRLAMQLVVLGLLLASLVSSVMAVRYYNHAGFIVGMPVGCDARQRWHAAGTNYVRKAGILYSWSLRQLTLVVPLVAFILHPMAGLAGAVIVVAAMANVDRIQG